MANDFDGAQWIARAVPAAQRTARQLNRTRTDWAEPGHSLGQAIHVEGPVVAVSITVVSPPDAADPYTVDVKYSISLETPGGGVMARDLAEGPQLTWDRMGRMLEVDPPAPPGDYVVVLRSERETIGWSTADTVDPRTDDGISPLQITGTAFADGERVSGVRVLGVETLPAPNPLFRRVFELDAAPTSAAISATVLGTGVIRINGHRVGNEALEPAVTDYNRTVEYRTWDVTHLLKAGTNEIIIAAGRERYSVRGGDVWGWNYAPWHREPVALVRLDATGPGETSTVIVTDASWVTAPGPVVAERLFRGEDWVITATDPRWEPVTVASPPTGVLRHAMAPPVRPLPPVPPVVVENLNDRTVVHDFGTAMVGRIRCRITGSAGAEVRVRSGEQRDADGSVICINTLVAGEAQLDTLLLETDVTDMLWEPQFGYRGFWWVQVETSGDVVVEEVRAIPLYADVATVGELRSNEPVIEWINAATGRTFRNNLHGIPTDTPVYEKNGWTADAHLATEGVLHHFDLQDAFGKWVEDHIDAQAPDGAVPWIIPTPDWGRASDPTWSSSAVLIPWYLYQEYGNRAALERAAPMIRRFADDVDRKLEGGLWRHRTWGDWLSPGNMVGPEGMAPIGTIMAVTVLQHTAAVLRELGEPGAETYDGAAERTATAYHDAYFDPELGVYAVPGVPYRQVLNILPLAFSVVPEQQVGSVRAGLIRDLEDRTDGHLDCGAVGVRHLLGVLSAAGRDDLAVTVLTQRTRPGWGAWFEEGQSTLFESWDVDARSRNHYFLGSVSAWIQQRVGAMRTTEPGWKSFEVAPVDDPRVTSGSIWHRTPLGEARTAWERGPGGWRFEMTVPAGSIATIRVPSGTRELAPGSHLVHIPA
jgi:alpha-L-rhamnosidase